MLRNNGMPRFSPGYHGNRYQLMLCCWRSEPQARLDFTQLKYSFQSMISASTPGTGYISIQPKVSLATDTKEAHFE